MVPSQPSRPLPWFVLDASAIVHGANLPASRCRTTPRVAGEFRAGGATRRRLDLLLAGGLTVQAPGPDALARVEAAARASGGRARLSPADVEALALALEIGPDALLVTDDYTMQDVARRLHVAVSSVATRGADGALDWSARCAGCGRAYDAARAGSACPVCGATIRAKPRRVR